MILSMAKVSVTQQASGKALFPARHLRDFRDCFTLKGARCVPEETGRSGRCKTIMYEWQH
jgi:hypothetical protein